MVVDSIGYMHKSGILLRQRLMARLTLKFDCQKLNLTTGVSDTRFAYVGSSQWEKREAPPEGDLEV